MVHGGSGVGLHVDTTAHFLVLNHDAVQRCSKYNRRTESLLSTVGRS